MIARIVELKRVRISMPVELDRRTDRLARWSIWESIAITRSKMRSRIGITGADTRNYQRVV